MKPKGELLKNKLRVLVTCLPFLDSLTIMVLVGAGSRYEQKEKAGIAHFLEHMFFKGTKKRPNTLEISSLIDGIGGEFNAFTSKEYTGFYIKATSKYIDLLLDVLSDLLLNSKLEPKEIEKERGVIFEELRMYLDTPVRYIADVFEELLYKAQPLGFNTIGNFESLKIINRQDLSDYLSKFYAPNNMVVSIAGGIKMDKATFLVEKYFGGLTNKNTPAFSPVSIRQEKPAFKVVNKKTEQAHLCLGVHSYPRGHPNRYRLALLHTILGASMSSRLFIQLRERRGLAYYVRTGVDEYADCGFFAVQAGVKINKIEEAIKVILDEFSKLTAKEVSSEEMKKAKEYVKGKMILDLEDSREVAGLFGLQELLERKIRTPREIMRKIDAVSPGEVKMVATEIFKNNRLNLAVIGPYKEEEKFEKILKI